MIAIPCVLYVDDNDAKKVEELLRKMDEKPLLTENPAATLYPDLDRKPYEIGSYQTPEGAARYRAVVKLEYTDPARADPDTPADEYRLEVTAKNSFEGAALALDRFHQTHPIGNLDAADIKVDVERIK